MREMNNRVSAFSRNTQRSLGSITGGFRTMRNVLVGAAAVFTTSRIARTITDFASAGDEIAKSSRRMGIGVEALQEIRFAAERAGLSTEQLTSSFEMMNRNIGQLRAGTGPLTTALARVNPMLRRQLRDAESSEQAFTLLLDAIDAQPTAAAKAALTTAAFGRAGQDLINMAEGGSAALTAMREEARRYGNIISEDAAKSSEQFTDAMTNLKASMTSFKNQALAPLIDQLKPLIERFTEYMVLNREMINLQIQETFQKIGAAATWLARNWENGLIPSLLGVVVAFKAISGAIAMINTSIAVMKGLMIALSGPLAPILAVATALGLIIANWEKITAFGSRNLGTGTGAGGQPPTTTTGGMGRDIPGARPLPRGTQRTVTENRQTIDINIDGLPRGSTVRTEGGAPSVNLNYGFAGFDRRGR